MDGKGEHQSRSEEGQEGCVLDKESHQLPVLLGAPCKPLPLKQQAGQHPHCA